MFAQKVVLLVVVLLGLYAVKAQENPTDSFPGVVDLTPDNFASIIDGSKDVFVEFYAPWCGWCRRLVPAYRELGQTIQASPAKESIAIAKLNAADYADKASEYGVRGFPTLLLFKKGDTAKTVSYEGDRSVADMIKFLTAQTGLQLSSDEAALPQEVTPSPEVKPGVVELTPEDFDKIVLDTTKNVLVKFYAPWCGHCTNMAPTYEELGKKMQVSSSNVVIAKIDASKYKDIGQRFSVRGFPTIKYFPAGDKSGDLQFTEERTLEKMSAFVQQHIA